MLPEPELAPGALWSELLELATDPGERGRVAARAAERGQPDAADRIVEDLTKLLVR
jgi:UDP-N-acetylglucosamine:LPS N-acetylglucosamine transferase